MSTSNYPVVEAGALVIEKAIAFFVNVWRDDKDGVLDGTIKAAMKDGSFRKRFEAGEFFELQTEGGYDICDSCVAQEALEWAASARYHDGNPLLSDVGELRYHSEFAGSATSTNGPSVARWQPLSFEYEDDAIAYLPAKKEANLFAVSYDTVEDLEREFRHRLITREGDNIIPVWFDIRPYIMDIAGTYYC